MYIKLFNTMKENEYIYFCFRLCLSLSAYIEMKGTVWFILVIIIEIQLSDGKKRIDFEDKNI